MFLRATSSASSGQFEAPHPIAESDRDRALAARWPMTYLSSSSTIWRGQLVEGLRRSSGLGKIEDHGFQRGRLVPFQLVPPKKDAA
jgi:hypothetical protein